MPKEVAEWRRANFKCRKSGRAKALILIRPPGTGKMAWAYSFSRLVMMINGWNLDVVKESGFMYVVLNDINLDVFPYLREFAGC